MPAKTCLSACKPLNIALQNDYNNFAVWPGLVKGRQLIGQQTPTLILVTVTFYVDMESLPSDVIQC